jgi:hypothetical protein
MICRSRPHMQQEMKMGNMQKTLKATTRETTMAVPRPARILNEAELDRVAAAKGMAGGTVGTNA